MVEVLGECPVASAMRHDGQNGGIAAGRACWLVASAQCPISRSSGNGARDCHECQFYRRVMNEEKGKAKGAFRSVPA